MNNAEAKICCLAIWKNLHGISKVEVKKLHFLDVFPGRVPLKKKIRLVQKAEVKCVYFYFWIFGTV